MFVVPWLLAVLTQASAGGPVEVVGRVEDAKRQPIAGAEVWVSGLAPAGSRRDAEARATSDAQGRFRMTVPAPKDVQTSDLPLAVWVKHAAHGLRGQTFTRQSLAKAKVESLVVKLAGPGGATVRVLGPSGGAVKGAKVLPLMVRVTRRPARSPPTPSSPPIPSPMNWPSASRPRPGQTAEARSLASRRPTWRGW